MRVQFVLLFAMAGCAVSNVVPVGGGTYLVTKVAPGCGFASAQGPKVAVYEAANDFCAAKKLEVKTVVIDAHDGIPAVRCANAELQFQCVEPGSKP